MPNELFAQAIGHDKKFARLTEPTTVRPPRRAALIGGHVWNSHQRGVEMREA